MTSDSQKAAELNETFGLGVEWSQLSSDDLNSIHRVTDDPNTRMRVVKRVARQMDSNELLEVVRAAAQETGGPLGNLL